MFLSRNQAADCKQRQKGYRIAHQPDQDACPSVRAGFIISVSAVEHKRRKADAGKCQTGQEDPHRSRQSRKQLRPVSAGCFQPFFTEIIASQKEWIKEQSSWDAEEISQMGKSDQDPGSKSNKQISRDFPDIRSGNSPEEQCHKIPQGKFRAVEIKPGIFMDDQYIQKIVKQLKHKVRNCQLLDQLLYRHILFRKIPGDKNKSRHMERKNYPF